MTASGASASRIGVIDRWQRFWFSQIPPHQFALLRIVFGLVGLIGLLELTPVSTFWSLTGIVPLSGSMAELKTALLDWNLGAATGLIFFTVLVASFVAMTIGCLTRAAVGACFFGTVLQNHWNPMPLTGGIQVVTSVLFCLLWVDCGAVWSIDVWRQARRAGSDSGVISAPAQPIWPLHLIRVQIAIAYVSSGLWKLLFSPVWRDGSAIHFVLQQNAFSRLPNWFSPALDPLLTTMTYFTLFWELGFPLMLLNRWTRRFALVTGVLLHLGMWACLEIGPFSWIMIGSYAAFLEPQRTLKYFPVPNRRPAKGTRPVIGNPRPAESGT
jgi:hypothetical protein